MEKQQKITRERRKWLQKQLKLQMQERKSTLYIAALFSWGQFMMRLVSFVLIAMAFGQIYQGQTISIGLLLAELMGLNIIGYGLSRLAKKYQGEASRYARNQLKKRFFDLFQGNEGYFSKQSFADIVTIATQGIDSLDTFYQQYLTTTLRVRLNCLTIWLLMLYLFPLGSVLVLITIPLIPISIVLMQKRSQKIMQRYWASYMDVGNLFMDDLKGMNTLYSYGASEAYEQEFVEKAEEFRLSTMELLKFQLQSVGYMDGVMYIGISLAGFFAAISLWQGQLTVASFVLLLLVAAEFFAPIRELGYCMHLLMMNTKMADRIFTFFESVEQLERPTANTQLETIEQVTLEHVVVEVDGKALFEPLDATFKKGQFVAIAGESGVGKTSLSRTLLSQLPVANGEIRFDTHLLTDISREQLHQHMMYVSPQSYVFNTSILENLQLATTKTEAEIIEWLDEHHLCRFINKLPEGIHTVVGEDGQRLSPGQRQQLLVARTLLSEREIYLFDEMTSSVDRQVEEQIFQAVRHAKSDAIVLWISHKMKEVAKADSVLFMQTSGSQQATPKTLYEQNATYREYVATQERLEAILDGVI